MIIGATNRIDSIDPALRRPGRFDREFHFPLPGFKARKEILKVHTRKWDPQISDQFLTQIASKSHGFSGADLKAVCTEASLRALKRTFPQVYSSNEKLMLDVKGIRVDATDFANALRSIVPTSARSIQPIGRNLPERIKPLLKESVDFILQKIRNIFPEDDSKNKLNEESDDDMVLTNTGK